MPRGPVPVSPQHTSTQVPGQVFIERRLPPGPGPCAASSPGNEGSAAPTPAGPAGREAATALPVSPQPTTAAASSASLGTRHCHRPHPLPPSRGAGPGQRGPLSRARSPCPQGQPRRVPGRPGSRSTAGGRPASLTGAQRALVLRQLLPPLLLRELAAAGVLGRRGRCLQEQLGLCGGLRSVVSGQAGARPLPQGTTDLGATRAASSAARGAGRAGPPPGPGRRRPRPGRRSAGSAAQRAAAAPDCTPRCASCFQGTWCEAQAGSSWTHGHRALVSPQPPGSSSSRGHWAPCPPGPPGRPARTHSAHGVQRPSRPPEKVPAAQSTHLKPNVKFPGDRQMDRETGGHRHAPDRGLQCPETRAWRSRASVRSV